MTKIATTPEIDRAIADNSPIAAGVSGGKDSSVLGLDLNEYLDSVGHTGERILVHSDLGRVEWKQSLPKCEELAEKVGWPLVVVRRKAGDMLSRWEGRWYNNTERYENLECVKVILPWSTPSMRFCTSELKTAVICSQLKKRYSGVTIVNAVGIRREESAGRRNKPVWSPESKLRRDSDNTTGVNWNPIIEYSLEDVYASHKRHNFELHEAYTKYGVSRVSCSFCIMASNPDLMASSKCEDNQAAYRAQVDLEIKSGFAFKGASWLGDVNPALLSEAQREGLAAAKVMKDEREKIESELPKNLLFVKGWPTAIPTQQESRLIASVRTRINQLQSFDCKYLDADSVSQRYSELILLKEEKDAKRKPKKAKLSVS